MIFVFFILQDFSNMLYCFFVFSSSFFIYPNIYYRTKKSQINGNGSENLRFIFCLSSPKCNRSRCYKASPMQSAHRSAGHGNRFRIGCIEAVSFRDNPRQIFAYNPNPLSNPVFVDNMPICPPLITN